MPRLDDFVSSEDSSAVGAAPVADVVLGVEVASELVTVTVAVWARLLIEVLTSAGSVWPGVNTYAASCTRLSIFSLQLRLSDLWLPYSCEFDLSLNRMVCICIDGA